MEENKKDYERLKRCAARYVWRRRHDKTPTGILWVDWFENKFKKNYYEYINEIQKNVRRRKKNQ